MVGVAFTFGPTIASGILALGPWPWLFAVNLPFGVVAMLIGIKMLPPTPRTGHAFDFPGALLTSCCLGLFIIGIGSAAHGATAVTVIIELAAALVLGFFLQRRHADHPAPMLPIDLFRRALFALSAATAVCSFAVQGLAFVSLPFYFEDILHRSQVETGFFLTPWPLVVAVMAPIGGHLSDRYPAGLLCGIGLVLLGIGMALLALLPADPERRQHRLAHDGVRHRVRLLPDAEPEGDHGQRTVASQRQRQRHGRDRALDRTDHRRGAGRALLHPRRPPRRNLGARARRGLCRARQRDEFPAAGRAAAGDVISVARMPHHPIVQTPQLHLFPLKDADS